MTANIQDVERVTRIVDNFMNTVAFPDGFNDGSRQYSHELVLTDDCYALAVGPLSTVSDYVVFRQGEVNLSNTVYGPPDTQPAAAFSARRPWVGRLPAGKYRVYHRRRAPSYNGKPNAWYSNQPFGATWIATGNGTSTNIVVTDTSRDPAIRIDVIAYHTPVSWETLPKQRAPHRVNAAYILEADNTHHVGSTNMDVLWAQGVTQRFLLHTEDRSTVQFHVRDTLNAATANWTINIYGVDFSDVGYRVEEIQSDVLFTVGPVVKPNLYSLKIDNPFDGWVFEITRTVADVGKLWFKAEARD